MIDETMITEEEFKKLKERVEKLEKRILEGGKDIQNVSSFKGLSGGIRFLIANGFFNSPKSVEEIKMELDRESYFYPYKSVHKILIDFIRRRDLTRIKEADLWKYVIRK